jgi:hypothetical protein
MFRTARPAKNPVRTEALAEARRAYAAQLATCLKWVGEVKKHPEALWKTLTRGGGRSVAEWFMLFVFGISAGSAVAALHARHQQ